MRTFFFILVLILTACSSPNTEGVEISKADTTETVKLDTVVECLPFAHISGIYNGRISRERLSAEKGLSLSYCAGEYKITSYRLTFFMNGAWVEDDVRGSKFDAEVLNCLLNARPHNSKFVFDQIRITNSENVVRVINPIIINISEHSKSKL